MRGRHGDGGAVLALAAVSVGIAAVGHSLGHGHALDLASVLVAGALAAALGSLVARRWTLPRLLAVLAAVQVVVHSLGGHAADPRLVAAAAHGHAQDEVAATTASPSTAMVLWHVLAVPTTALLLAALARSAALVTSLVRRWSSALPVVLPALEPAPVRAARLAPVVRQLHVLVSRSNAPPCPV